jgi:hypothetical protein
MRILPPSLLLALCLSTFAACAVSGDEPGPADVQEAAATACAPSSDRTGATVADLDFQTVERGPLPAAIEALSWGYPTDRAEMATNFGAGRNYDCNPGRKCNQGHEGADLGGTKNVTEVRAAAEGTVAYVLASCPDNDVRNDQVCGNGWGNHVVVRHAGGVYTRYAHLHAVAVAAGATVAKGQALGALGHTGLSTGPHLHFELGTRADAFDPCGPPQNFDVVYDPALLGYDGDAPLSKFPLGCRVTADVANVRSKPDGDVVRTLQAGSSVAANWSQDGWYAVTFRLDGQDRGAAPSFLYMAPSVLSCR